MEVGSWEEREVGKHSVESVQPPLDVEGRAPVEEDSKGDNWGAP
jgi:hypothetical protein